MGLNKFSLHLTHEPPYFAELEFHLGKECQFYKDKDVFITLLFEKHNCIKIVWRHASAIKFIKDIRTSKA